MRRPKQRQTGRFVVWPAVSDFAESASSAPETIGQLKQSSMSIGDYFP